MDLVDPAKFVFEELVVDDVVRLRHHCYLKYHGNQDQKENIVVSSLSNVQDGQQVYRKAQMARQYQYFEETDRGN